MSGFDVNADTEDVSVPEGMREGLPRGYRMRADAHYVDQLASRSTDQPVRMIGLTDIDASGSVQRADLEPLVQSIRVLGVVQPLLVRRQGMRYGVIAGRKRFAAAGIVGLPSVPCLVHDADDAKAGVLALADNLTAGSISLGSDAGLEMMAAVRRTIATHLTTVQTAAGMLPETVPAMRPAAIDLIQAHAWRAARLLDALDIITKTPVRARRKRSIHTIVDELLDGFSAETRSSGARLQATIDDDVSPRWLLSAEVLIGLSGAVFAVLPLVEHVEQAVIDIQVVDAGDARGPASDSLVVTVAQTAARVSPAHARRFFDETSPERPEQCCAVAGALAARLVAERHGGHASFEVSANGGGVLTMTLSKA